MLLVETLRYEKGKDPRVRSFASIGEKKVAVTCTGPAVKTKMDDVDVI